MDYDKIKCVILDFDNTLYSDGDWSGEIAHFEKYIKHFQKYLNQTNAIPEKLDGKKLLEMYPGFHIIQAIYAYLREHNLDESSLRKFDNENVCNILCDEIRFINPKILEDASKCVSLYLISDSSKKYLEYYMDYAKIDKNVFIKYLSNQYDDETLSKIPMMKKVLLETGFRPEEIIMIGDSKNHDILPAENLGFQTCLVDDVKRTEEVLNNIILSKSRF